MNTTQEEPDQRVSNEIPRTILNNNACGWKSDPTTDVPPKEWDVLCGRGKTAYLHRGNRQLQQDMIDRLPAFEAATNRFEKSLLVREIIQAVLERGGRFLKKSEEGWFVAGFQDARDKVSHALRNNAGRGYKALYDPTRYDPATTTTKQKSVNNAKISSAESQRKKKKMPAHRLPLNLDNRINKIKKNPFRGTITPWDADPTRKCIPHSQDVLCGRGKRAYLHPGNQRLQMAIAVQAEEFQMSTKSRAEKSMMVHKLIASVRERGRFLKKDGKGEGEWYLASFNDAREKISHAFRNYCSTTTTKRIIEGGKTKATSLTSASTLANADTDFLVAVSGLCSLSKNTKR